MKSWRGGKLRWALHNVKGSMEERNTSDGLSSIGVDAVRLSPSFWATVLNETVSQEKGPYSIFQRAFRRCQTDGNVLFRIIISTLEFIVALLDNIELSCMVFKRHLQLKNTPEDTAKLHQVTI